MGETKKIGIEGHTGMIGSELTHALEDREDVEIVYTKNSTEENGQLEDCDLVFLATKDDQSMEEAPKILGLGKKVIDLSGAFRIPVEMFEKWYKMEHACPELIGNAVYGMPALNAEAIKGANLVANPGCYVTAVVLAVKPLAQYHIEGPLRINATSGISGARKGTESEDNTKTYASGRQHKHVPEMDVYSGIEVKNFSPSVEETVFQGINANIEVRLQEHHRWPPAKQTEQTLRDVISNAYVPEDMVKVVTDDGYVWGTKDVKDTNLAFVKLRVEGDTLYMTSIIDNLGKGATSQAIENMNLMLGLERHAGLDGYLE